MGRNKIAQDSALLQVKNTLRTILERFFTIDLRALAFFRISLALLTLAQLINRSIVLKTFYTDQGLFPRALAVSLSRPGDWSIYFLTGNPPFTALLFIIAAFFALLLLVGYRTWLATLVSYLFIVSLQTRNPVIPNGGDYLLRLLVFWSLFLPLGACFSLDSILNPSSEKKLRQITSMGTAAFLLQVFFVYFFTVLSKLGSEVWLRGNAAYDALTLEHYGKPLAGIIAHAFPPYFYKFLTYLIIEIEFIGLILLFFPFFTDACRLAAIALLAMLQLGFGLCLEVNLFPWVAVTATLPFLPGKFCDDLFHGDKIATNEWHSNLRLRFKRTLNPPHGSLVLKASPLNNLLAGFFLIYIFFSNLEGLTYKSPIYRTVFSNSMIPGQFRWFGNLLALDQFWDMFIPPGKVTYWFVAPGKLKDGSSVDLLRDGRPVRWEKPKVFFKNEPWRAYLMNLGGARKDALSPYVGPYFCREWNKKHRGEKHLQELEVFIMSQENLPNHQVGQRHYASLLHYVCPADGMNNTAKST
jgi:hypothetical protein